MPVTMKIKKNAAGKTLFPIGFNRAILVSAEEHATRNNASIRLTLRNGQYEHREDLWMSEGALARLSMMAKRLGLVDGSDGAPEDQEVDFEAAVGKEFVIDIDHEQDSNDQTVSKITYSGLWPLDHSDKRIVAYLNTDAGKVAAKNLGEPTGGNGSGGSNGKPETKPAADIDVDDI